jgi:hypothetical protein
MSKNPVFLRLIRDAKWGDNTRGAIEKAVNRFVNRITVSGEKDLHLPGTKD